MGKRVQRDQAKGREERRSRRCKRDRMRGREWFMGRRQVGSLEQL